MSNKVTVGADPEMFVYRPDPRAALGPGSITPICGLVGGEKGAAKPFDDVHKGYAYQEDNVMLEFNIPPATSVGEFVRNISLGLELCENLLTPHGLSPFHSAEARVPMAYIQANPQAAQFGCSPDFDAYTHGQPHAPIDRARLRSARNGHEWEFRFAGGHVHIGLGNNPPDVPPFVMAAFADAFIGLPMAGNDRQGLRRQFYGTPGRYRPTDYGIEYRTLSNHWLWSRRLTERVGRGALMLGRYLLETPPDAMRAHYASIPWDQVCDCIARGRSQGAIAAAAVVEAITGQRGIIPRANQN